MLRSKAAPSKPLPARLSNARDLATQRELPETNPAQPELTQKTPRPPAMFAAIPQANRKLGSRSGGSGASDFGQLLFFFRNFRSSCHR
jgi:hypothetical protein